MRSSYAFVKIADSRGRFRDFRPYVASIDDRGVVSFQAALLDGGSGVFAGDGGAAKVIAQSGDLLHTVTSHPDRTRDGTTCFYATLSTGQQAVVRVLEGQFERLVETGERFAQIGPLGPTMNEAGTVAFRATLSSGHSGIFWADGRSVVTVADTAGPYQEFFGLPVVDARGTVVFRAALRTGAQAILATGHGASTTVAQTGPVFRDLALFPCANQHGAVVFAATLTAGGSGIFLARGGQLDTIVDSRAPFASFRGALVNDEGTVLFLATPHDGQLGLFTGPDPTSDRVLGIGDSLFDSVVTELALNPVSLNDTGQLALRVQLADGLQLVVRADPAGGPTDIRSPRRTAPRRPGTTRDSIESGGT